MYEYDRETKTLTLNEWREIRLLTSEISLLVASWNYACVN